MHTNLLFLYPIITDSNAKNHKILSKFDTQDVKPYYILIVMMHFIPN